MMNYDEFLDAAMTRIGETLSGTEVSVVPIEKLQGESYLGLSVRPEQSEVGVSLNVRPAYDRYLADESVMDDVLHQITLQATQAMFDLPVIDSTSITEYGKVKDHLTLQMVPVEPNRERLAELPHRIVEDMAVVYRVELPFVPADSATVLITNRLLDSYGITPDQLHEDALAALLANHPPVLKNLADTVAEMTGGVVSGPESPMWVASVDGGLNGAAVTQLPSFLEEAADKLGGDYYVLPSSIHEVLFVRDDGMFGREELESMVRRVNAAEVSEADYLSDSVYHYDSVGRVFEKAVTYEQRMAEPHIPDEAEQPAKETITVLLVEPEKYPRVIEMGTELEDFQSAVGGFIEPVYPFRDQVALVVNDTGKLDHLPLNRALRDENGEVYDVIAGPFLVVGLTFDSFDSLTPEQLQKYEEHFHQPELFLQMGKGVMVIPMPDEAVRRQEEKTPAVADKGSRSDLPDMKPRRKAQEVAI